VVILLQSLVFAEEPTDCQISLDNFKAKLDTYSHYNPNQSTGTMKPEVDMTQKRENDDTKDCFSLDANSEIVVNCESHYCLDIFYDLVKEYDATFSDVCSPANGFIVDANTQAIMTTLRNLKTCNRCEVLYTAFSKVEQQLQAANCLPSPTFYSCDASCPPLITQYIQLYENMILRGECKKNDPGGCGPSGGMTAGQIYDKLTSMTLQMSRIYTVDAICHSGCAPQIRAWNAQWKPLAVDECLMSSNGIDVAQEDIIMQEVTLEPQCDPECQLQISDLIKNFNQIPIECQKAGLTNDHFNALVTSINMKSCEGAEDSSDWDIFGQMTVAKGFFTLSILGFGCVLVYLLGGIMYRRCVKGKKGWQACPSFSFGKKSKKRISNDKDGEEEVILFEAEDDDDHL